MEHIPGHKNNAANCLSQLHFAARKRNNNPLNDEDVSINETQVEVGKDCCPLCEVELTDMKTLQQSDKHCIKITKLMEDPRSRFHERDSYGYDDTGLLYHITRRMARNTKPLLSHRPLSKLTSRRCMIILAILV